MKLNQTSVSESDDDYIPENDSDSESTSDESEIDNCSNPSPVGSPLLQSP